MNDKEKLEAIYEIINKKAKEMDDPPVARGTSTSLPKDLWTDIPEYKKILEEVVEHFIGEVEMPDYEQFENINKLKKEITEHFDKLFKSPEFERMMDKALDEDDD
jgi:hypothetical protein